MRLHFYLKHFPLQQTQFGEGTSKAVHGLAMGLAQQGLAVTILCEGPQSGSFRSPAGYQVECFPAPTQAASFQLSSALRHYVRSQLGPEDLVVLNGIFHPSVFRLARLLRRQQVPYVMAPHDPYHPAIFQQRAWRKRIYWRLCEKPTLQGAQAVQLLDSRHQEWLVKRGVTTPAIALPNGLDPRDLPVTEAIYPFQTEAPRLIFLGRFDSHNKGLDLLLQGFCQFPSTRNASLTFQGPDWGDRAALVALAEQLALGDRVRFLPPNYDTDAAVLLTQYDIFCVVSRFEGFSLSALEAMLAGRVLLISNVAGLAPHVEASQCGLVVEPTIAGVQAGLEQLWQCRDQWAAMGQRGRDYAMRQLNWPTIAQQAIGHYNQVIHSPQANAQVPWKTRLPDEATLN
jgi:glycosyltransferase involved in cell wall biosynthesis